MAIREVLTAPRSPWQSPYVERLIGSVRRECLDHLIVLNESVSATHSAHAFVAGEDAPETRPVQGPELGSVVGLPEVGGLHHRYERRAA